MKILIFLSPWSRESAKIILIQVLFGSNGHLKLVTFASGQNETFVGTLILVEVTPPR
jgi:hypothetical protein